MVWGLVYCIGRLYPQASRFWLAPPSTAASETVVGASGAGSARPAAAIMRLDLAAAPHGRVIGVEGALLH